MEDMNRPRLLSLLLLCVTAAAGASQNWELLLERNPFVPYEPPKLPPPEPPPPYEFRGVSVENGVQYFSLYNLETKKAVWVTDGRNNSGLQAQSYDRASGVVLADERGRSFRLALKEAKPINSIVSRLRSDTAVAAATTRSTPLPQMMPAGVSESGRLDQVAEQIRNRRAQRLQAASARI